MSVEFLSQEWATRLKDLLNARESFKKAAGTASAKLQQVITGGDGERGYWIRIEGGSIDMGQGEIASPDATITQDYATAVALAKNEMNPVTAFMMGKIRISGNMALLLQLQGAFAELPKVMQEMDVDY